MAIKKINLAAIKKSDINLIADFLLTGGVVACPTDTIYGLSCLATDIKAISVIRKIKNRPKQKGFIILVSDLAMAKKYANIGRAPDKFLKKIWPGPYTIVLPSKHKLPNSVEGEGGSLAMRCPNSDFLLKLIKRVGCPLISTSVNISGGPILNQPTEIISFLKKSARRNGAVLLVDGGRLKKQKPSTIVDLKNMSNIKILR